MNLNNMIITSVSGCQRPRDSAREMCGREKIMQLLKQFDTASDRNGDNALPCSRFLPEHGGF